VTLSRDELRNQDLLDESAAEMPRRVFAWAAARPTQVVA
jgi:hypothetical protein